MEEKCLSTNHLNTLNCPQLIDKWMIFHFPRICTFLNDYFHEQKVIEICDPNIHQEEAVKRFHRHVLDSDNDNLYIAIVNYCEEMGNSFCNLIETMWIDMDNSLDSADENTKMTRNQYKNLLTKYSEFVEKFNLCLNDKLISSLLNEYSNDEDIPPSGEALLETLMRNGSIRFYNKVCMLLQEQRDKYKECVDFMSNSTVIHDEEDQQRPESVHSNFHELTLIKSQLDEVICAMGGVVWEFTEDIHQLKQMVTNLNDENRQLRENLAMQDERHLNELNGIKKEIKLLQSELATKDENSRFLYKELKQLKTERGKDKEQINMIRQELTKRKLLQPFRLEPSLAMKEVQKNYKLWCGLAPVLANEWGVYPTVNWAKLGGTQNWNDRWTNIIHRKYHDIYLPPLILPTELGGWCVQLIVTWTDELTMRGNIIDDHPHYKNAPQQLDVHFKLQLSIKGIAPFVFDEMFKLKRSSEVLWHISPTVDKEWPLPLLTIEVDP